MPVPAEPPRTPTPDEIEAWQRMNPTSTSVSAHGIDRWLELHGYVLDAHDRAKVAGVHRALPGGPRATHSLCGAAGHDHMLEVLEMAARLPEPDRARPVRHVASDTIPQAHRARLGLPLPG